MPFPRIIALVLVLLLVGAAPGAVLADVGSRTVYVGAQAYGLAEGTPIVAELVAPVSSRKKDTAVGDLVRARVAQDVVVDGQVLIDEGAELLLAVYRTRKAKFLGRRGEIELRGVSVRAVDGATLPLDGFYLREGRGRKLVTATLEEGWRSSIVIHVSE